MNAAARTHSVQFHEQSITVLNHNDKPYVAMKSIVENIGLDWDAQRQRINRHAVLSKGAVMITAPSKGGNQEYLALPLSMLNGWLFGVDANRVRPEIKSKLIQYQTECFDVLFNHFMPNVAATQLATANQKLQIRRMVENKAKSIGGTRSDYSIVWRKVQDVAKFSKLDEMTPSAYQAACDYFEIEPLAGEWEHEQPRQIAQAIPDDMQLIPKLQDDEYFWKGKVVELNPAVNHGNYKSRTQNYHPEQCVLIPINATQNKDFELRVRNGVVRIYEKLLALNSHESHGWGLSV